jgi:hypothetical protein
MSAPPRSAIICGFTETPPCRMDDFLGRMRQRRAEAAEHLADLRRQFARGHQHQHPDAPVPSRLPEASRCSKGSAKAAVLPEPVGARPSRSWPRSSGGMASTWMAVGVT